MKADRRLLRIALVALALGCGAGRSGAAPAVPEGIKVREGFELSVAREGLQNARFMALAETGTLYVSQPRQKSIVALRDADNDGYYENMETFVDDYAQVHGMQWHDGWLWFTTSTSIHRGRDTNGDGRADEVHIVVEGLPGGRGHWWRPILIHGGRIYTGVGDSGNATENDGKRQRLYTFDLDGKDERLFVTGTRNTEKLVVRPGTDEVWGMDHGSDNFGAIMEKRAGGTDKPITDLTPPEEMNRYEEGKFYGHPYIIGDRLPRYEFIDRPDIVELAAKTTPPMWKGGAHWAANAMTFYTGDQFPADHQGDAFVAYHGSWNRDPRDGYCVTRVLFDNGKPYGELPYISFMTESLEVLGRPVDVTTAPDGSLLISEDKENRIYRLRWTGGQ